jgi:MSHA biogenesis protein MshP
MSITRPDFSSHERGFGLIAAIFLLVALAGLAGFVVTVSNTQSRTQVLDLKGSQAQQAARAGVEWAIYQLTGKGTACATIDSTTLSTLPGLADFTISFDCQLSGPYTESSTSYSVYQVTVTACNASVCPATAPVAGYVENVQRVRVMK